MYENLVRNKKAVLIAFVVFLLTLFFIFFSLSGADLIQHQATETPLPYANRSSLVGDNLYTYTGAGILKTDMESGDTSVVVEGVKLPTIKDIYWGKESALMTFSGSYINSAAQPVLLANGYGYFAEDRDQILWHFDYNTGRLKIVSKSLVPSEEITYNHESGSFYFVSKEGNTVQEVVQNGSVKSIGKIPRINKIKYLTMCELSSLQVCGSGDVGDTNAALITLDGELLIEAENSTIIPTSNSSYFLTLSNSTNNGALSNVGTPESVEKIYQIETLVNISKDVQVDISVEVEDLPQIASVDDDGSFYIVGNFPNKDNGSYVSGFISEEGKSSGFMKLVGEDGVYEKGFFGNPSYNQGGVTLISNTTSRYVLLSKNRAEIAIPEAGEGNLSTLQQCVSKHARSYKANEENSFEVFFNDNSQFENNLKKFTSCIHDGELSNLLVSHFNFTTVNPVNGIPTSY